MADPKKPQKPGCMGNRNVSKVAANPGEKPKSRDKYKSDIPLQTNQIPVRPTHTMSSLRAEGEWFKMMEAATKGTGSHPEENTNNNKTQDPDYKLRAELEDAYIEEGEQQMMQEEIDNAYSEYLKSQHKQDEEMEEAILNQLEHKMWSIAKELKNRKNSPSWKKMGFFKEWLKAIMDLVDEGEKLKPAEPTIAYLTETNAYLTRKLNELESNTTPVLQTQTRDPNTQATPMAASMHPT